MGDDKKHNGLLEAIHSAVLKSQRDMGKFDGRMSGLEKQLHGVDAGILGVRQEMQNVLQRATRVEERLGGCEEKVEDLRIECAGRRRKCSAELKEFATEMRGNFQVVENTGQHNLLELTGRKAQWKLLRVMAVALVSLLGAAGTALGIWNTFNHVASAQYDVKRAVKVHGVVVQELDAAGPVGE